MRRFSSGENSWVRARNIARARQLINRAVDMLSAGLATEIVLRGRKMLVRPIDLDSACFGRYPRGAGVVYSHARRVGYGVVHRDGVRVSGITFTSVVVPDKVHGIVVDFLV